MDDLSTFRKYNIHKSPRYIKSIESFAPTHNGYYQKPDYEPPTYLWFDKYLKALHILAQTYDSKTEQNKKAMKCFIVSLAEIVPNQDIKNLLNDFIIMSSNIQKKLFDTKSLSVTGFFTVNNQLPMIIKASPESFFDYCLTNSDILFVWTYLLHCYYNLLNNEEPQPFNSLKQRYAREIITKSMWGPSVWYIIHFSAYHCPSIVTEDWRTSFIAFMSCLQNVLPCSVCRQHIKENLPRNDINRCINDKYLIFEWTWKLHNIVNESLNKPILSLEEAKRQYDPFINSWIQQNANTTRY